MTADRDTLVRRLIELDDENQRLVALLERCNTVLTNMTRERLPGWRRVITRWEISDEPLHNDAKNLLPLLEAALSFPDGQSKE
jgi:hypothetical protein